MGNLGSISGGGPQLSPARDRDSSGDKRKGKKSTWTPWDPRIHLNAKIPIDEQPDECPICLDLLEWVSEDGKPAPKGYTVVNTVCNHRFHGACLKEWYNKSRLDTMTCPCPCCRRRLTKKDLNLTNRISSPLRRSGRLSGAPSPPLIPLFPPTPIDVQQRRQQPAPQPQRQIQIVRPDPIDPRRLGVPDVSIMAAFIPRRRPAALELSPPRVSARPRQDINSNIPIPAPPPPQSQAIPIPSRVPDQLPQTRSPLRGSASQNSTAAPRNRLPGGRQSRRDSEVRAVQRPPSPPRNSQPQPVRMTAQFHPRPPPSVVRQQRQSQQLPQQSPVRRTQPPRSAKARNPYGGHK